MASSRIFFRVASASLDRVAFVSFAALAAPMHACERCVALSHSYWSCSFEAVPSAYPR
jgi:hypothetical protein